MVSLEEIAEIIGGRLDVQDIGENSPMFRVILLGPNGQPAAVEIANGTFLTLVVDSSKIEDALTMMSGMMRSRHIHYRVSTNQSTIELAIKVPRTITDKPQVD